jgi:hypothetical protein
MSTFISASLKSSPWGSRGVGAILDRFVGLSIEESAILAGVRVESFLARFRGVFFGVSPLSAIVQVRVEEVRVEKWLQKGRERRERREDKITTKEIARRVESS